MNKIHRLIWNEVTQVWVAVAEIAQGRSKRSSTVTRIAPPEAIFLPNLTTLVVCLALTAAALPAPTFAQVTSTQLPTGGNVVAGTASITQNAAVMNINQTTNRAAIDWNTFNVGSAAQVNFNQPSSSSVTLNRVLDSNPSQIFGRITAPGQVFLVNPNGVFFAPGASVDVGGLVATTHRIGVDDFMAGKTTFERNGATGSVINAGELKAALGGYIALLAPEVRNEGVIIAQAGTVALASGEAITLNFADNGTLAGITATQSQIAALVENKNAVFAPGGLIILSAQAMHRLQGGVINNSGRLEATGLVSDGGRVLLDASDSITHTGSINVDAAPGKVGAGGTAILLASLSNPDSRTLVNGSISARGGDLGGDGGFIETSAANVRIMDDAQITTAATNGRTGTWLIDPFDFTVAATGGNITGAALGTLLASNSIQIETATAPTGTATNLVGTTGTNGDIHVSDAVTWSANTTLTLKAFRNININQAITAGHATGKVALHYGQGALASGNTASYSFGLNSTGFAGKINLVAGNNFITKLGSDGAITTWTVITALGSAGDELLPGATNSLQGLDYSTRLAGTFVLGANIDASATSGWNSSAGFLPIGIFTGKFDGLGHTISNLTINRSTENNIGLFSAINGGEVRNLGLTSATISALSGTGSLAGSVYGGAKINNVYSAREIVGSVTGTTNTGGLIGYIENTNISNSYSSLNVIGTTGVGGLIGTTGSTFTVTASDVYAKGNVTGNIQVGGLAGTINKSTYSDSYATGNVTYSGTGAGEKFGGFAGSISGVSTSPTTISRSYATGTVTGGGTTTTSANTGGFVGLTQAYVTFNQNYAEGPVTAPGINVGGFVGIADNNITLSNNYARGTVNGHSNVGGFVGAVSAGSFLITNNYSTGRVTSGSGQAFRTGGFAGYYAATINASSANNFWDTTTSLQASAIGSGTVGTASSSAGKTTAEMKALATFTGATWDIATDRTKIWSIADGSSYPCLTNAGSCPAFAYLRLITGSSIYGNTPTLTYGLYDASSAGTLISNASPTGTVTWSTVLSNTSAAATYSLTYGSGITLGSTAYSLQAGAAVNWTINKAHLTVTADNKSRLYGAANPTFTTTVSGFVNGENAGTAAGFAGAGTASSTATTATNVGSATITAGAGTLSATNYDFTTLSDGTLTVNAAPLTVTASNDSKTFDGLAYTGGNGVTYSGFVNSETATVLGGTLGYAGSSQGATNAGSYLITPNGLTSSNYALAFANGTLTVNAATSTTTSTTTTSAASPVIVPPVVNVAPSGSSGTSSDVSVGQTGSNGISISIDQDTSSGLDQSETRTVMLTVSLPSEMATAGNGFSFELPASVQALIGNDLPMIGLGDGSSLPAWIRFNPATMRFEAQAVPDGAFPLQVLISTSRTTVLIAISERKE